MASTSQSIILSNVMDKLDDLPLTFDITSDAQLIPSYKDALREMSISDITGIEQESEKELYVELRTLWWALFRFRNTSSVNFKYNTGTLDGKAVDKTKVMEAIDKIMSQLDDQYQQWKNDQSIKSGTTSSLWTRTRTQSATLR